MQNPSLRLSVLMDNVAARIWIGEMPARFEKTWPALLFLFVERFRPQRKSIAFGEAKEDNLGAKLARLARPGNSLPRLWPPWWGHVPGWGEGVVLRQGGSMSASLLEHRSQPANLHHDECARIARSRGGRAETHRRAPSLGAQASSTDVPKARAVALHHRPADRVQCSVDPPRDLAHGDCGSPIRARTD